MINPGKALVSFNIYIFYWFGRVESFVIYLNFKVEIQFFHFWLDSINSILWTFNKILSTSS